jgi:fatty-acyl-CoA synthase
VIQLWGLTETNPLTTVARPPAGATEEQHWRLRDRAGRLLPLVEARLVDEAGRDLPWDGEAVGEIQLAGPWIASSYYQAEANDKFGAGWFRTGDIGSIDEAGFVRITDRAKDVIKSGGEWISSLDIEAPLVAHPAVAEVAVIAKPDGRWTERPLACIVPEAGVQPTAAELHRHLAERLPRWWLPDAYAFVEELPKTSTGKLDKKLLRERLARGELGAPEPAGALLFGAATGAGPAGGEGIGEGLHGRASRRP